MEKDRNLTSEVQKDIEFLKDMIKEIDDYNYDYIKTMINDWVFELERIEANIKK